MVNDQLVNWIKENGSRGYTPEQLRASLLQRYSENDVNDAFSAIAASPAAAAPSTTAIPVMEVPAEKKSNKKLWMIIGGAVLIVGIIVFLMMSSNSSKQTTQNLAPQKCIENWSCTDLSSPGECVDGQQTVRTCVDSNNCGTAESKPSENEDCVAGPSFPGFETLIGEGQMTQGVFEGGAYEIEVSMIDPDGAYFQVNGVMTGKISVGRSYTDENGLKLTVNEIEYAQNTGSQSMVDISLSQGQKLTDEMAAGMTLHLFINEGEEVPFGAYKFSVRVEDPNSAWILLNNQYGGGESVMLAVGESYTFLGSDIKIEVADIIYSESADTASTVDIIIL